MRFTESSASTVSNDEAIDGDAAAATTLVIDMHRTLGLNTFSLNADLKQDAMGSIQQRNMASDGCCIGRCRCAKWAQARICSVFLFIGKTTMYRAARTATDDTQCYGCTASQDGLNATVCTVVWRQM
jgi:hypothetical protein